MGESVIVDGKNSVQDENNPDIERNFMHLSKVSLQAAIAYKDLIEFVKTEYKFDLASMSCTFECGQV